MSLVVRENSGDVATLTINRPQQLNALNEEVLKALSKELVELSRDTVVKVILIRGSGDKSFVAGADIEAMKGMTPDQAEEFAALGQRTFRMLESSKKVTIAVVQGFALGGGCELAMSCDFIFASKKAKFGQPEVNLGVIPGFGGTQRLLRLVGVQKAREFVYTGKIVSADEAAAIGLATQVFAPEELEAGVQQFVNEIVTKSPYALAQAKQSIRLGQDMDLTRATYLEKQYFAKCFGHPDQEEGMTAFLEKRKPNWS